MEILDVLILLSALGCALIAGVFFAFSTFVMKALGKLHAEQGIAAMQSINLVVINKWFLSAFVGTALTCGVLLVASLVRWPARAPYLVAGSVLYLVGTFLVTGVCNVPRNEALAKVVPGTPEGGRYWAEYLRTWTAWNHVRTGAAFAAALSLTMALRS